jgi:hypothetical protein
MSLKKVKFRSVQKVAIARQKSKSKASCIQEYNELLFDF